MGSRRAAEAKRYASPSMNSFRFKSSERVLSSQTIRVLRQFTVLSISEIRTRAANGQTLLEFPIFDNNWQDSRRIIMRLLARIDSGQLPLDIYECSEVRGYSPEEELQPIGRFRERLQMLHEIALEQDMARQLELGDIQSPEEYEPPDENEA